MSGHIRNKGKRLDGSNKWEARWRSPLNPLERREKIHRTKQDAERWLSDLENQAYTGTYVDTRNVPTLENIAADWQSTWLDLEPKTISGYKRILQTHIIPKFGSLQPNQISPDQIQRWVAALSAPPRSPTTVKNIYGVLRALFKFAERRNYVARNPCDAVRLPRARRQTKRHLYLTPPEVSELAAALPAPYDTAAYVAAYTGLRAGELWALRREDVDLLNGTLRIERAFKEVYLDDDEVAALDPDRTTQLAPGLLVGSPKSRASNRVVSMPAPVKALLVTYLAGGVHCGGTGANDLIFTNDGEPVRHSSFYRYQFRPVVRKLWPAPHELNRLRWHDMRHTCAALSLAVTPNLHVVKERLGHESITMTIDTYGHLLPSVDAALMDGLAELFNSAQAPLDNIRALRASDAAEGSS